MSVVANVNVHPLVIASTCDHYTRVSSGGSKLPANAPVYGLLFGTRASCSGDSYNALDSSTTATTAVTAAVNKVAAGVSYTISDSVDLVYNLTNDGTEIELVPGEIERKVRLWTAVFTTYELIGWYTFGEEATVAHLQFHEIIRSFTATTATAESLSLSSAAAAAIAPVVSAEPVMLLINQNPAEDADDLPISVHVAEDNAGSRIFVEVPFKIETSEAEKVALDHITSTTPVGGLSNMELQNQSINTSLRILDGKVGTIIDTLKGMQQGTVPIDHCLLRQAAKICQALPPVDSELLVGDVVRDMSHAKMLSYLSAVTATATQLNEVGELYTSMYGDTMFSRSGL